MSKIGERCRVLTGTRVGHGQKERTVVLLGEGLVVELGAVDGLATGTIALGEVTALEKRSMCG